jgi:hypothetical protein
MGVCTSHRDALPLALAALRFAGLSSSVTPAVKFDG